VLAASAKNGALILFQTAKVIAIAAISPPNITAGAISACFCVNAALRKQLAAIFRPIVVVPTIVILFLSNDDKMIVPTKRFTKQRMPIVDSYTIKNMNAPTKEIMKLYPASLWP
jgi:hypothetical protein